MTEDRLNENLILRLKELEEENSKLRAEKEGSVRKVIVVEGNYKGHPTLTFEGSVRRFTLGLSKLRALKESWAVVDEFLNRHQSGDASRDDEEDIKI